MKTIKTILNVAGVSLVLSVVFHLFMSELGQMASALLTDYTPNDALLSLISLAGGFVSACYIVVKNNKFDKDHSDAMARALFKSQVKDVS